MGDSSSARNATSGEDPQYEADLELAKRLSLESWESEKRRRNVNDLPFSPEQNTGKYLTDIFTVIIHFLKYSFYARSSPFTHKNFP